MPNDKEGPQNARFTGLLAYAGVGRNGVPMKEPPTIKVPFNDPERAVTRFRNDIDSAIARVLDSGWYILGSENSQLAEELSSYLGVTHAILVGNGTDALEVGLRASGVQPNDLVATVANAGGYASTAIRQVGANPIYVDIEPESLQMEPDALRRAVEKYGSRVVAVIVTHLFGQAAKIEELSAIARDAGITVIEDCAQSLGAKYRGRLVGTFGDLSTTSFYPTKNLGALGDGGAIFTSDPRIAESATRLRQYGWVERYNSQEPYGRNSRIDEIQAAILRLRLKRLDDLTSRRQEIFSRYQALDSPWGKFPHAVSEQYVGHLAVFLSENRDELIGHLAARGIQTAIHYPVPDYRQPGFMQEALGLPNTEEACRKIVSIPLFPELEDDEVRRICEALLST